jgi:hypothetical protein
MRSWMSVCFFKNMIVDIQTWCDAAIIPINPEPLIGVSTAGSSLLFCSYAKTEKASAAW